MRTHISGAMLLARQQALTRLRFGGRMGPSVKRGGGAVPVTVRGTTSVSASIVVLTRDAALAARLEALGNGARCTVVASGYEAAAEILAGPVAALVVDFRALGPAHVRLLGLARRRSVELLGMGKPPEGLSIAQLSGMRLVSADDLPAAIRRAAAPPPAPAAPPAVEVPPTVAEAELAQTDAPSEGSYVPVEPSPVAQPPRAEAEGVTQVSSSPRSLLTPEELAALLEDHP